MKRLARITLIIALCSNTVSGQSVSETENIDSVKTETAEKFYLVDKSAEFPGRMSGFYRYISKKMKYPKDARQLGIEGKVYVDFVIDATGEIRKESVKIKQGVHPSCDEEAIRLIKESPKWKPAFSTELNKNVAIRMVVPIIFKL